MTVRELIEQLQKCDPDDTVDAYEGEQTGLTISGGGSYAFIVIKEGS